MFKSRYRANSEQGVGAAVVESGRNVRPAQSILLRVDGLQFDVRPGDRLRILNVRISMIGEDIGKQRQSGVVATMRFYSEAFLMP